MTAVCTRPFRSLTRAAHDRSRVYDSERHPVSDRTLLIYDPDGSTREFELTMPMVKIGRASENDLVLEGSRVSRMHAQIACKDGAPAILLDLKSANGVLVNGRPVEGPTNLYPDDVLLIGPYKLIYSDRTAVIRPAESFSSPFRIEEAAVDINELQQQPRLVHGGAPDGSLELRSLELLHEVGVTLARTVTVEDVIETSVALLFKIEGVQRATLMLWDEKKQEVQDAELRARAGAEITGPNFDPRRLVLSKTILRRVRQENRPLHIQDARSEAELSGSKSIVRAGIQAAFCSPLTFHGRLLGVLYADNLEASNALSPADFRLFTTIAAQAGLALATALSRGELLKREVEQAAMRLYMPSQVADLISATDGGIELGGLLQPVTVLFADIRGFARISERMDAREVVLLLNEFFTAMTAVILEAGGTLDKYIGDCVMALFGAPTPAEDDAERALSAAIGMQLAAERVNFSRSQRGLPEIQIGVGLHTGCAVIGNIGSEQRMQYTAIGDTVNVAARLVDQAAAGQIVVSEDLRRAVATADAFDAQSTIYDLASLTKVVGTTTALMILFDEGKIHLDDPGREVHPRVHRRRQGKRHDPHAARASLRPARGTRSLAHRAHARRGARRRHLDAALRRARPVLRVLRPRRRHARLRRRGGDRREARPVPRAPRVSRRSA